MDHIRANELMDLYGSLLTARQQQILQLYFQEDFSLTEIQEDLNISRAAVSDTIRKGIKAMENYESKLGLLSRNNKIRLLIQNHPEMSAELEEILF